MSPQCEVARKKGAFQRCLKHPALRCCWPVRWPYYLFRAAFLGGECFCVNMHRLALSLGLGFLFHVPETWLFAYFASVSWADAQGLFPRLENVGAFKKVSVVPTHATCGLLGRSTFCQSPAAAESLRACPQQFCIQDCPYRSSPATYTALFSAGLRSCIIMDKRDLSPKAPSRSASLIFGNHKSCFASPPVPRLAASFTLAVWLKAEQEGVM